jgi:hypothetical protein
VRLCAAVLAAARIDAARTDLALGAPSVELAPILTRPTSTKGPIQKSGFLLNLVGTKKLKNLMKATDPQYSR